MLCIDRILSEFAKLYVLEFLSLCPMSTANDFLLRDLVMTKGVALPRITFRALLTEMAQQRVVACDECFGVMVVRLLEPGREHVAGTLVLDGVRAPRRGA